MARRNHPQTEGQTMPKYEIRCNTERVLLVEAEDEQSALQTAEQTDFSDWDLADSPYSIEQLDSPPDSAFSSET
jgi:hypothetical protein